MLSYSSQSSSWIIVIAEGVTSGSSCIGDSSENYRSSDLTRSVVLGFSSVALALYNIKLPDLIRALTKASR